MIFKLWSKGNKTRLYLADEYSKNNAFIDASTKTLFVGGGTEEQRELLSNLLTEANLTQCLDAEQLIISLELSGHEVVAPSKSLKKPPIAPVSEAPIFADIDVRTPQEIALQSESGTITKAPFKKSSKTGLSLVIDTREPASFADIFNRSPLSVHRQKLDVGDVVISAADSNDILVFERKTISDLYSSVISTHLHSQAERLYEWQKEKQPRRTRVVWIIEGEQSGRRMLYNALPQSKQVDGLVNYWVGVLGQHMVQSFNSIHSAYLIHKIAQGFFEKQLPYPVKSDNGHRIDMPAINRNELDSAPLEDINHGVAINERDTLFKMLCTVPAINARAANALIGSGLPLSEILTLTETDLICFDGIAKKTAANIVAAFKEL